jgi:arylsulfatase
MVVTWPKRIKDAGGVRSQFHHIIDIAPTILEATGIPAPAVVNGVPQKPIEGVSLAYTFDDAKAAGRRRTQYLEMFANRGLYHDGWMASVFHGRLPWATAEAALKFEDEKWELYHIDEDFSQANDLAARNPRKLRELQDLFWVEAGKYNVLPLDDRLIERLRLETGLPVLGQERTSFTYYPGAVRIPEPMAPDIKNKSHRILAEIEVTERGPDGVLVAQGGTSAGWALYVSAGRLTYTYNFFGSEITRIEAKEKLPAGAVAVRYEFAYDGGGRGKGGTGKLFVGDKLVAEGRIPHTAPAFFSAGDTFDLGIDAASVVDDRYADRKPFAFTGAIEKVVVELGDGSKPQNK